jgi:hypothetical protein
VCVQTSVIAKCDSIDTCRLVGLKRVEMVGCVSVCECAKFVLQHGFIHESVRQLVIRDHGEEFWERVV